MRACGATRRGWRATVPLHHACRPRRGCLRAARTAPPTGRDRRALVRTNPPPARPSAPALLLQFQKERDALQAELDSLKHAQEETKKELSEEVKAMAMKER